MAIITFPLDNIEYGAAEIETYLCTRTSGIFSAEDMFSATVTGRTVTISGGLAWVKNADFKGKSVLVDDSENIEMPVADAYLDRIDVISLRFDSLRNETYFHVIQGTPAENPTMPSITRTAGIYDLGLKAVYEKAGSINLTYSDITDLRLNEDYCGIMRDSVTGIPTSEILREANELISQLREMAAQSIIDTSQTEEFKNQAQEFALKAQTFATSAEKDAQTALENSEIAESAAESASVSSDSAISAAAIAESYRNDAQGYAEESSTNKEIAVEAKQSAEQFSTDAKNSAEQAREAAERIIVTELAFSDSIKNNVSGTKISIHDSSNIRPITFSVEGNTDQAEAPTPDAYQPIRCVKAGTKIVICGKNLIDISRIPAHPYINNYGTYIGVTAGSASPGYSSGILKDLAPALKVGDVCTLSGITESDRNYIFLRGNESEGTWSWGETRTITQGDLDSYVWWYGNEHKPDVEVFTRNIQIEYGSVATAYEPYAESEVTLPCDLYEGDIWYPLTGVVERYTEILDAFATDLTLFSDGDYTYFSPPLIYSGVGKATHFSRGWYNEPGCFYTDSGMNVLCFCLSGYVDDPGSASDVKSWCLSEKSAGRDVLFEMKLIEPEVESYEPQELIMPYGEANVVQIEADMAGGLRLTYKADTKLYIDRKFNELTALILEG